ncbi:4Fe-4S binding protein [Heliorestis acidaminivorans]|uniref:4Fe-4S binding protein n=1 Tax=Heliorestis acidaminivorans TaxID=553427 RepID=A0A6I0F1I6_9FIRM|nr:4Fe-4S binding protein [Heliorestis acidaminivorans]KAB2952069.1 4Fe-4S binding protein [Heliorestis acidaminivorans]
MEQKDSKPINLLQNKWIRGIFNSQLYPRIFQWAGFVVFAIIIYAALFDSTLAHKNFGIAATWVLWWPLIPLFFFLLGRFWCAICPFAWLNDIVQKYFGAQKPVPKFLRKYGIWIIDAFFIIITWADHIFGIVESPRGSGYLLLIIVAMVVFAAAFWQRRTFCRYICFIGGLSGNYSRSGVLELRATPEKCKVCTTQACYKGGDKAPGCPVFEFPRTMEDNTKCNLCGHCIKNCPNDSLRLTPRVPTKELWYIRQPRFAEAALAIIIMGIVLVQNVTMLDIWPAMLDFTKALLHTDSFNIAFTAIFATFMAIPFAALWLTSVISRQGSESIVYNMTIFGYAIIPLDLAAHMSHNLFHLLTEINAVWYSLISLFTGTMPEGSLAIVHNAAAIYWMQMGLLALGFIGSAYSAYRIAGYHYTGKSTQWKALIPHLIFLALFLIINIYIFNLPMAHRV